LCDRQRLGSATFFPEVGPVMGLRHMNAEERDFCTSPQFQGRCGEVMTLNETLCYGEDFNGATRGTRQVLSVVKYRFLSSRRIERVETRSRVERTHTFHPNDVRSKKSAGICCQS
jgi:hypothetical protein